MHITKKNFFKCGAVVRLCKNFLLRAVAGPRSCKKNQNVVHERYEVCSNILMFDLHKLQELAVTANTGAPTIFLEAGGCGGERGSSIYVTGKIKTS
jgi:hypothetical protein